MKSCINYQKPPSLRAEVNKDRIVINKALKNGETQIVKRLYFFFFLNRIFLERLFQLNFNLESLLQIIEAAYYRNKFTAVLK